MRHRVEVGLDRGARHAFEGGLGAQHARRPVGLGVDAPEQPEQRLAQAGRQRRAHALFHQVQPVAAVAAEGLVAAVARQRHRDMLARELADAVGRDRRAVGIGLVVQARERVDQVEVVGLDDLDAVVRVVAVGHHLRELALVELRVVEADRAGVDGLGREAGHRRHHRAGVDAAGEEGAQRHLGDQAQLHRFAQPVHEFGAGILQAARVAEREVDVPVFLGFTDRLAAPDGEHVRRRQLLRLAEDRARLGHVAEGEVLFHRERVDVAFQAAVGQERLELGAEEQRAVVEQRVVQRLDAQPVPRHEQRLLVAVPQREGEHAAKALHAGFAPLLPGVDDDLGVALGVEAVAGGLQFGNQFLVVVDLAVEDHDHRAVLVEQRLLAGGDVDDAQPPVAEAQPGLDVQAAFVGAAVGLRVVHALEHGVPHRALAAGVELAGDAAHVVQLRLVVRSAQQPVVQALITRHHRRQAEHLLDPLPTAPAHRRGGGRIERQPDESRGHGLDVRGRNDLTRAAVDHQFGIAADPGGQHRQPAGHRFENGIRDALGQRRQRETIEPPHDIRHVGALAGQPGERAGAGGVQNRLRLGPQRAVADHHQAQALAQGRREFQRAHEGACQQGLRLHGLHAPDGADEPQRGVGERAAGQRCAAGRGRVEALGVHAVVDLRDAPRGHADALLQVAGEVGRERHVLVHERPVGAAHPLVAAAACRPGPRHRGHARRGCAPARRPAAPAPGIPAPRGCACGRWPGAVRGTA